MHLFYQEIFNKRKKYLSKDVQDKRKQYITSNVAR